MKIQDSPEKCGRAYNVKTSLCCCYYCIRRENAGKSLSQYRTVFMHARVRRSPIQQTRDFFPLPDARARHVIYILTRQISTARTHIHIHNIVT